jgi:hypothetical protein
MKSASIVVLVRVVKPFIVIAANFRMFIMEDKDVGVL